MTKLHDIDPILRSLDPADSTTHRADSPRARADLHRILNTDPVTAAFPQAQKSRPLRKFVLIAGAVAAATVAATVVPSLTQSSDPAFASWTAEPASIEDEHNQSEAADSCRDSQRDTGDGMYADDLDLAHIAIAERRGVWTTVVLGGPNGFSAMCITDDSTSFFGNAMIGSIGRAADPSTLNARELKALSLGTGTMSAGDISLAAGIAGTDIIGVSYNSPTLGEVTATVARGHFALWLPGDELKDASNGLDVTVTYSDGSTGMHRLSL
ncbi:hypothetical protein GC088_12700 [Arthrobacter sp. JZ12]|uniref:hypothetical protein n=1 Tax=Arthrobacter sp. JZ12 TaxID=2654190 RepID=UPI002B48FE31|nr:hypothetical protein [Arthrobacter sp. JZ12]WRH25846.1 hypothetical protein GC088_12700 [Arthrobacter sp. JZ12]